MEFLQSTRPLLIVFHGLLALALACAALHIGAMSYRCLRGRGPAQTASPRHGGLFLWVWVGAMVTGLLLYPQFRVDVRAACFDPTYPLATGFYEVKEHWLAIGLPVAISYQALARRGGASLAGAGFHVLGLLLALIITAATLIGLGVLALDLAWC